MTNKFEKLKKTIIECSFSNDWMAAKDEWDVIHLKENDQQTNNCICGQEHLLYEYTIKNRITEIKLNPIGSKCIKQFQNPKLSQDTDTYRQFLDLVNAVKNGEYIDLKSGLFTKRLLNYLKDTEGVFQPNAYNKFNPQNDGEFLIKMFNKKKPLSQKQKSKVNALIVSNIIPFAKSKIEVDNTNFINELFEELGGSDRVYFDTETEQDFGNYIEWPVLENYSDDELEWVTDRLLINKDSFSSRDDLINEIRNTEEIPEGIHYERDGDDAAFPDEAKDPRMSPQD